VKVGGMFPSQWLKSTDIPDDQSVRVVMDRVEVEEVGDGPKPVLYFQGKQKGLVLNKTNYGVIAAAHGDESDDWSGHPVLLYTVETNYQGQLKMGIRVKIPKPDQRGVARNGAAPEAARRPAPGQAKAPAKAAAVVDEDVPIYTDPDGNEVKEEDIPF
jgi:hypothetical protein